MNLKKFLSIGQKILVVLLGIILIGNLYLLTMQLVFKQELPTIFGFGQVIVISGSMEPTISAGDLLIIREQSQYQVDDIVTYEWGNSLCTHRIVSIEGDQMITKGDANNTTDEPTPIALINGKVVFSIPGFGNFILFLKTPFGLLLIALTAIALVEVPNLLNKRKPNS